MSEYIDETAASVARDVIAERKRKETEAWATANVDEMLASLAKIKEGGVIRFVKESGGKTYHYAGIRSGELWYLTGWDRSGHTDDALAIFITGLRVDAKDVAVWAS